VGNRQRRTNATRRRQPPRQQSHRCRPWVVVVVVEVGVGGTEGVVAQGAVAGKRQQQWQRP
jgi:hypothetical protein